MFHSLLQFTIVNMFFNMFFKKIMHAIHNIPYIILSYFSYSNLYFMLL
jgi:hypothetical protein